MFSGDSAAREPGRRVGKGSGQTWTAKKVTSRLQLFLHVPWVTRDLSRT